MLSQQVLQCLMLLSSGEKQLLVIGTQAWGIVLWLIIRQILDKLGWFIMLEHHLRKGWYVIEVQLLPSNWRWCHFNDILQLLMFLNQFEWFLLFGKHLKLLLQLLVYSNLERHFKRVVPLLRLLYPLILGGLGRLSDDLPHYTSSCGWYFVRLNLGYLYLHALILLLILS
jgi:hypothetical protein